MGLLGVKLGAQPTRREGKLPPQLKAMLSENEALINGIKKGFLEDERFAHVVDQLIVRYLLFTFPFPASSGYHHSEPGGLFVHGLEVGANMIRYLSRQRPAEYFTNDDGKMDSFALRTRVLPYLFCGFMAGLLHDIGKVRGFRVGIHERPTGRVRFWNPIEGPLDAFLKNAGYDFEKGEGIEEMNVLETPVGMSHSFDSMIIIVRHFFVPALYMEAREMVMDAIQAVQLLHQRAPRDQKSPYLLALEKADRESVGAERSKALFSKILPFFYYLLKKYYRAKMEGKKLGVFFVKLQQEPILLIERGTLEEILVDFIREGFPVDTRELIVGLAKKELIPPAFEYAGGFKQVKIGENGEVLTVLAVRAPQDFVEEFSYEFEEEEITLLGI